MNCAQVSCDLGCIRKTSHSSQNMRTPKDVHSSAGDSLSNRTLEACSSIFFLVVVVLGELKNFLTEASPKKKKKCTQFPKCSCCFLFQPCCEAYGILVTRPGIEPALPAFEVWSLNYWTAREFRPQVLSLMKCHQM